VEKLRGNFYSIRDSFKFRPSANLIRAAKELKIGLQTKPHFRLHNCAHLKPSAKSFLENFWHLQIWAAEETTQAVLMQEFGTTRLYTVTHTYTLLNRRTYSTRWSCKNKLYVTLKTTATIATNNVITATRSLAV